MNAYILETAVYESPDPQNDEKEETVESVYDSELSSFINADYIPKKASTPVQSQITNVLSKLSLELIKEATSWYIVLLHNKNELYFDKK